MSNKSMDEILETYVPSCMDKVLDHYEKQCKKMSSPSEEYKNNMEKLIRREKMRQLYHIPSRQPEELRGIGNQPSGRDDGFEERRGSAGEDV